MADVYVCWKCGADISHLPMPLGRMSKCEKCKADLHVCCSCAFYDKTRANQCQEPVADRVIEKRRANFCGYFQVKIDAFKQQDSSAASVAQQELSSLFGEPVTVPGNNDLEKAKSELDKLFGDSEPDNKHDNHSDNNSTGKPDRDKN